MTSGPPCFLREVEKDSRDGLTYNGDKTLLYIISNKEIGYSQQIIVIPLLNVFQYPIKNGIIFQNMHVDTKLHHYYKLIFGAFTILCVCRRVYIMYANFMFLKFLVDCM